MGRDTYVQFGCGNSVGAGWENFDNSPTLRLRRLPGGNLVASLLGGAEFPDAVRYGDIVAGPLAPESSCAGVSASHVLEHLSKEDFDRALRHTFSMLRPGGHFRLVVPDLEARARRYVAMLDTNPETANTYFMHSTHLGLQRRPRGLVGFLRSHFGNSAHLWMWDERALSRHLEEAGFTAIRRCRFNDCIDPAFTAVESERRFVDDEAGVTELAVECRKPD